MSWTLPPLLLPRAIQVSRTLHQLAKKHGYRVHAVGASPLGLDVSGQLDASLADLYVGGYETTLVRSPGRWRLVRAMWRLWPALEQLPDRQRLWSFAATRVASKLCEKHAFSHVMTFSQPVSDHLVGLALRRKFGIPWVAHFSDPWVDSPYIRWRSKTAERLNVSWERRVVSEADRLVFVNPVLQQLVMEKYPAAWQAKAVVIPHGYDPQAVPDVRNSLDTSALTLTYTGSFYGPRSPEPLLAALRLLSLDTASKLRIRLIGPVEARYRRLVTAANCAALEMLGEVSYRRSLEYLAQSDCLLLLDAANEDASPFLPSKLIDYLAFHKPVLGITPARGAAADVLYRLACPVVAPDDPAGIARELTKLVQRWSSSTLNVGTEFSAMAARYDIRRTTDELAEVMSALDSARLPAA